MSPKGLEVPRVFGNVLQGRFLIVSYKGGGAGGVWLFVDSATFLLFVLQSTTSTSTRKKEKTSPGPKPRPRHDPRPRLDER